MDHPTNSNRAASPRIRKGFIFGGVRSRVAIAIGTALGIGMVALLATSYNAEATRSSKTADLTLPLALPDTPSTVSREQTPAPVWQTVTVRSGDSLAGIFERVGLAPQVLQAVMSSGAEAHQLKLLTPGETLRFDIQAGELQHLNYAMDPLRTLEVIHNDSGYTSSLVVQTPEIRVAHATGVIDSSLYAAGLQAGLSDTVVMEMAEIFGWDIDFALDIRRGDRFSLIYEERYLNGQKMGDGQILAAEFINDGHMVRAVKYTDPLGHADYYGEDGRSMRKAFLRSPVDFRRISSRFQKERYHPVLGIKRPHQGVDYAAAIGTPIKAAGDGKIVFAGNKGGYGRTIIIQHGGAYSTLYGHLSRFNKNTHAGAHVRQGQVIGYVGKTGLATGPHLHYEFRVNGAHRNPLTVKLPDASPIKAAYKSDFQEHAQGLLAQLSLIEQVQVAASGQ